MSKIKISLELDDPLAAIEILKSFRYYEEKVSDSSVTSSLNEEEVKKSPPAVPNKKSPPAVPNKKSPPAVPRYDTVRADINNELTRIMNNNGQPRKLLNDGGYSTVAEIPDTRLIPFLEMLKGQ